MDSDSHTYGINIDANYEQYNRMVQEKWFFALAFHSCNDGPVAPRNVMENVSCIQCRAVKLTVSVSNSAKSYGPFGWTQEVFA